MLGISEEDKKRLLSLPIEKQREALALLEELEEYNKTHVLELYKPYKKQVVFHESPARERLFMAANQCITPYTPIETGSSTRLASEMIGEFGFGVASWDGSSRCKSLASHVFLKGIEPAFHVLLDNGQAFQCSRKHLVLTSSGWISLGQLIHSAGGLRLRRKLPYLKASYVEDGYPHGLSPHLEAKNGQERPPLPFGVRQHNRQFEIGDEEDNKSLYNHTYQQFCHQTTFDDEASRISALCENFEDQTSLLHALWPSGLIQDVCLSVSGLAPLPEEVESVPCAPCDSIHAENVPLSVLDMQSGRNKKHQTFLKFSEGQEFRQEEGFLESAALSEIFVPYHSPLVGNNIIAVVPIGCQPILDFEVCGTHCYESGGVIHHNSGKTLSGAAEVAMHLTGLYPDWWKGRRLAGPNKWWVAGESGESTRDNPQRLLLGEIGEEGTGMIPLNLVGKSTKARGVSDLYDHVPVKHVTGGLSHLFFKSYGKGREKWQGATLDGLWFDEEPPAKVYSEGLTRTNTKMGPVIITFTPMKGVSTVVHRFLNEENEDRDVISMTIDEVDHYTEEEKKKIIASYPEHEREARAKGLPMQGSGRVFTVTEESITADVQIKPWWFRIIGIDFGSDHPFAAVWMAWDKDSDIIYVYDCYRMRRSPEIPSTPIIHAAAIKPRGDIPVAWPLDGLQTEKGGGRALKVLYAEQGLRMLPKPARYGDERGNLVEPGLADMLDRMQTGRFKVASHLKDWWEEFRLYHREDGKVVKTRDDLMSGTRYGLMSIRYAIQYESTPKKEDMWDRAFNKRSPVNWKTV